MIVPQQQNFHKQFQQTIQICQQEINKLKNSENNLKNSINTITAIVNNFQNKPQNYQHLLSNLGITQDALLDLVKPLSGEIALINSDSNFQHFLIENPSNNVYQNTKENLLYLIREASVQSTALKCSIGLTEQNKQKILEGLLKNLKNVDSKLFQVFSKLLKSSYSYQKISEIIIKEYTGDHYASINMILTSNDPVQLSSMNYFVNLLIKSYEQDSVNIFKPQDQVLFRNISLDKKLLPLYQDQSYIYFTNLTSTSMQDLDHFGKSSSDKFAVQFIFKLLDFSKQKELSLFTGLSVKYISYHPKENEVLILPYQIFQITKIVNVIPNFKYSIELQEVESKQILNEIRTPRIKILNNESLKKQQPIEINSLKQKANQQINRFNLQQIEVSQQKEKVLQNLKTQVREYVANVPIQENEVNDILSSQFIDDSVIQTIREITALQEQINQDHLEPLDDKVLCQNLTDDSQNIINLVEQSKNEIEQQMLKGGDNLDNFVQNLMSPEINIQVQDVVKDYVIANIEKKIFEVEAIQQKMKMIDQQASLEEKVNLKGRKYLQSLNIQKNIILDDFDFLIFLLQQSYSQIDQDVLFSETIPECLKNRYLGRMVVSKETDKIYKIYFTTKNPSQKIFLLKRNLLDQFKKSYPEEVIDLACIKEKIEARNIDALCFIFTTSSNLEHVVKLMSQLEVNILETIAENKNRYLSLCGEFFDSRGNMNFLTTFYNNEERGNIKYCFPNMCIRVGLNVLDKYDNGINSWLNMSNSKGEWAAVYTWISEVKLCNNNGKIPNQNTFSQSEYSIIKKNTLQCSQSIRLLFSKVSSAIKVGNHQFKIAYQCRASPNEVQFNYEEYPDVVFIDRNKKDLIRPYGIIIQQIS